MPFHFGVLHQWHTTTEQQHNLPSKQAMQCLHRSRWWLHKHTPSYDLSTSDTPHQWYCQRYPNSEQCNSQHNWYVITLTQPVPRRVCHKATSHNTITHLALIFPSSPDESEGIPVGEENLHATVLQKDMVQTYLPKSIRSSRYCQRFGIVHWHGMAGVQKERELNTTTHPHIHMPCHKDTPRCCSVSKVAK